MISRPVVYLMTNEAMPFVVKVGESKECDVRSKRLYYGSSGVPVHFDVRYVIPMKSKKMAQELEAKIHTKMSSFRVNEVREFFGVLLSTNDKRNPVIMEEKITKFNKMLSAFDVIFEMCRAVSDDYSTEDTNESSSKVGEDDLPVPQEDGNVKKRKREYSTHPAAVKSRMERADPITGEARRKKDREASKRYEEKKRRKENQTVETM